MFFSLFFCDLWLADALEEEEVVRHIHEKSSEEEEVDAGQGRVFTDEWNALVSDGTLIV